MKRVWTAIAACMLYLTCMQCGNDIIPADDPRIKPQPGYPCGPARHQCSDGDCCFNGWDCTTDRPYMPDPPHQGYCEDALGKRPRAQAHHP